MRRYPFVLLCLCVGLVLGCGGSKPDAPDGGGVAPGKPTKEGGGKESLAELQKLLDSIPKDTQPRADKDGEIERNKAHEWLKKNAKGKPIAITVLVGDVIAQGSGVESKYNVWATLGNPLLYDKVNVTPHLGIGGRVRVGSADWAVMLKFHGWKGIDEASAKRIRDLKGKVVPINGKVGSIDFSHEWPNDENVKGPIVGVEIEDISIDGFTPKEPK